MALATAKLRSGSRYRNAVAELKGRGKVQDCWSCGKELYADATRGDPNMITLGHYTALEELIATGDTEAAYDPRNYGPQCPKCNYGDGARRSNRNQAIRRNLTKTGDDPSRAVILLCGPSGAGKTTLAKQSGLTVYDRDDPHWTGEKHFIAALTRIGQDPTARVVVIRAAATSHSRRNWATLTRATATYLVVESQAECARRITSRRRADVKGTLASLPKWFGTFDNDDNVPQFRTWAHVDIPPAPTQPAKAGEYRNPDI